MVIVGSAHDADGNQTVYGITNLPCLGEEMAA
jgi:hypothetical protein